MEDPLSLVAISGFIRRLMHTSPRNRLHRIDNSPIYEEPILGVADGDDPLFQSYKTIIGEFHLTPREAFAKADASSALQAPDQLRVLCWVLPITHTTCKSNAEMTSEPSERWIHTYFYGEAFNDELRREVERYIRRHGGRALAPALSPVFKSITDDSGKPSSTWSERHALFAAGLGTFGLCDGFITPAGKAMRCGSVITDVPLPVTPREYETHTSNCPFLSRGTCG
ncbi:MAG: epoxyqueuosine reductase, partial [Chloroflexota bacterium]